MVMMMKSMKLNNKHKYIIQKELTNTAKNEIHEEEKAKRMCSK